MPPTRRASRRCASELGVDAGQLARGVKDALRKNTDEAAARGVFGVPSFVVDGEVFWGADAIGVPERLPRGPGRARATTRCGRVDGLPVAAARKDR